MNYYIGNQAFSSERDIFHHGVLGMKWGVRRYQPYSEVPRGSGKKGKEVGDAKTRYQNAKENYKRAVKSKTAGSRDIIVRSDHISDYRNKRQAIDKAADEKRKAKGDLVRAKRGEKAEKRYYIRQMSKTGLPGSYNSASKNDAGDRLYDSLVRDKGQAYADEVFKKTRNQAVSVFVASSALAIGGTIASAYLSSRS